MHEHGSTSLLVVIVNYRTPGLTIDCLGSLSGEVESIPGARVVVTDNASGDDSATRIGEAIRANGWGGWASIQPLDRNGGFAAGNNAAIRPAIEGSNPPRYVLLLNPDTIVRPGALGTLLAFMEAHPEVGLAGSRLEEPDGTPQRSAFRFHSIWSELDGGMRLGLVTRLLSRRVAIPTDVGEGSSPADWVSGACLIVRGAVFEAVGLLDEGYFMYYEEMDFCRRARRAGWPCWYVPSARVVHLVGQSSGINDRKKRLPEYWFRSRRHYFLTHFGRLGTLMADLAWALGFATFRVRQVIQGKPDNDPPRLLQDFIRYNFLRVGR